MRNQTKVRPQSLLAGNHTPCWSRYLRPNVDRPHAWAIGRHRSVYSRHPRTCRTAIRAWTKLSLREADRRDSSKQPGSIFSIGRTTPGLGGVRTWGRRRRRSTPPPPLQSKGIGLPARTGIYHLSRTRSLSWIQRTRPYKAMIKERLPATAKHIKNNTC